ncbi:outer membrane beta-barrel protein [Flavobacterium aestivum]|uniref:outer membrane beta-barrel protein n=1 Tax=Flavobacterium aestivum TaxID=3003257 RepID=UPI0022867105|nr:outer membrane beta-barrel protein [Flavobacterium aestivum]
MIKTLNFLFFLLLGCSLFAQNNLTIKGRILKDGTQVSIESATVYLTSVKDSTVIDYTITDKNGFFKLNVKKIDYPVFLKVSSLGYKTFKQEMKEVAGDKDFGTLHLLENENILGEVVIKSDAPPIRIKKDTLEFNATSFKVRPDANVETLLKQLPGVDVSADGKITVNGKEVNQVLVNGKPFFDKDGKIALQNLPSDIIKKVQITDTKTKKEELSKQTASSNNSSINLTIDEDKNKGFFGKFMGGFGSSDRYESSALINYFKNKRKLSVLASSNNINSVGFSMDEVFDNMGGGRGSFYTYTDGSFGMGNMRFGGGTGIIRSDMLGVNYSDEWSKNFDANGSYFFNDSNGKNTNRTKQANLLPTNGFVTESKSDTKEDRMGHNMNLNFEYKIDSTTTLNFSPKFIKTNRKYSKNSSQVSNDLNDQLLNESTSSTFDENDKTNFNNEINFNKAFKRKGRILSLVLENENEKENINSLNKSKTTFYQDGISNDIRDQKIDNKNLKDSYSTELEFIEPINDSLKVKIGALYNWKKTSDDRNAFDYDVATQSYTNENDTLSSYQTSNVKTITPKAGFGIGKKKLTFDVNLGTSITQFDNHSLYLNKIVDLNKEYALPFASAQLSYKFGKSMSIWSNYNYRVEFPTASQVLPVVDLTNPLNTLIGNPNLNPDRMHSGFISFRNFDMATKSGYSVYCGMQFFDNQFVESSFYDENRKQTTTYTNVDGTYYSYFGVYWNKTIKKEANLFKLRFSLNNNISLDKGFTNGVLYDAKTFKITPGVNFSYEYGELLVINPSYSFTYNETNYTNYLINSASNVLHKINIQTTNYWPKNWVFGNDFGYTYNSNITDGFKKDFYLWNTSLAYSFFNKKMSAKVKVYDVLNQNQSATRTITPTTIRDEENLVLKRYVMFSLTYKIEKFAGKEKPARNRMGF